MASITYSAPLPPPAAPTLSVGPVGAVAPVAFAAAQAGDLPLPAAQAPAPAPTAAAPDTAHDGAAMRPDQVLMARQLVFQRGDAATLGASWRSMVRHYGHQLSTREQQAIDRQLAPALLAAAQDGRVLRQPDQHALPPDLWRFTVHAGGAHQQHLSVIAGEADQPPGRRRRTRAALRLEVELADGVRIVVQVEPMPGGVALELSAPDAATLARLRELQPVLEKAVQRAGLEVGRWTWRDRFPAGPVHARVASYQAENILTLPVFRAVAELALLIPEQASKMTDYFAEDNFSK
ncbi:hypothetical protein [Massilia consociata]|uniref:Flagellar hook-length control protein FliK n=1 Tax=Massilia consociata TaxID=760117 RepID=A0ABV6FAP5_9BURK